MTPGQHLLCTGIWNGRARYTRYRRGGCWWELLQWRGADGRWTVTLNQPKEPYADA